ncbi:MAG: recombinase family protein [SAR202 cluster bacterium]|nr:recombinase family protein [SAR202 cluster bacterium]
MPTAVVYIRVSTPGQAEVGLGLEAQREACERIALHHGLTVPADNIIVEQASGEFIERDGLDRVRSLVRAKQVSAVVCYDTDRLSRDEVWQAVILREARDRGVDVYTLKGTLDTSHTGSLVNFVTGWAAALEKEKIRQRTMDGKRATAKAGILPVGSGAGLYGYDYQPRDRASKRPQARTVNQAEAAIVRRMFAMALEGLGLNTIAAMLNRDGITGKTGSPWSPWTLKNTLRNPTYAGVTRYGKESTKLLAHDKSERHLREASEVMLIEGFTPALVDMSTFERVQAHLARPRRSGHAREPYLLSGTLRCACCGTSLTGQKMGGRWRYYVCRGTSPTAKRPQICHAHRPRMEQLDQRVWTGLMKAVSDADWLYDRVMAQRTVAAVPEQDGGAELRARVKALAAEEKNLVAALRSAPSAAEAIGAELEKIASGRRTLERELKALQAPRGGSGESDVNRAAVNAFAKRIAARMRTMDLTQRREVLALLGFEATIAESGSVDGASIEVPLSLESKVSPTLRGDRGQPETASLPGNPTHHWTNMGMTTWT